MRSHKHWPLGHPRYESAPTCDLPTKKECDARYRKFLAEERAEYDARQLAMKTNSAELAQKRYDAFVILEARRVAEMLEEKDNAVSQRKES